MLNITDAARTMGCPEHEILEVGESPAGDLIFTSDGNAFIVVPTDAPDHDGKTGLMFLTAPVPESGRPYIGGFPVFTNPPDDSAAFADPGERDGGVTTKDDLLAQARDLGIDAKANWGEKRLLESIAAAQAAATAEAAAQATARHDELIILDLAELVDIATELGVATEGLDETALVDAIMAAS